MASPYLYPWQRRPPLQLQFTVQGGKRVLPLTEENVAIVFKTVLTAGYSGLLLGMRLGIPDEHHNNPASAAAWWITHGDDRRWRCIIYYLDRVGETDLADELMPYSEPPSDPSLTAARVTPILMELEEWESGGEFICGHITLVREHRANIIRRQHTSTVDQKKAAAIYFVKHHPYASWSNLARCLYQAREKRAIEAFKAQLPKPKDPTLTVEAMMAATEGVTLPELSSCLDMPYNTYKEIIGRNGTGRSGRQAVFAEFLSHHPYPRWELVIELLVWLEREGKARAGLAQEVKEKYPTKPPAPEKPAGQEQSGDHVEQKLQSLAISPQKADETSKDESCEKKAPSSKKSISYEIDITDLEFGDVLGGGGFGTVFQGKWRSKGIPVALKSVRITPDASDAKVMKELGDHPNIISFYGFAYRRPETIIVTALARKGSLYDLLHVRKEKPTEQQSLAWAKQIAYGMAYMHKLDYVHRDLKSSNVLFSDDMVAQVADFGTARFLKATTVASKTAGTLRWMAPEVANDDAINKQCDVFSYALVIWELMEHKIPFPEARTHVRASISIINGERPPISGSWPDYLSSLTQACWAPTPNDRPTFSDVVASLENKKYFKR